MATRWSANSSWSSMKTPAAGHADHVQVHVDHVELGDRGPDVRPLVGDGEVHVHPDTAGVGVVVERGNPVAGARHQQHGVGLRVERGAGPGAELVGPLEDPPAVPVFAQVAARDHPVGLAVPLPVPGHHQLAGLQPAGTRVVLVCLAGPESPTAPGYFSASSSLTGSAGCRWWGVPGPAGGARRGPLCPKPGRRRRA